MKIIKLLILLGIGGIMSNFLIKAYNSTSISTKINIEAEGEALHYQKISYYSEKDFSTMTESTASKETFKNGQIELFTKGLKKYNRSANNHKFVFDETEKSITFTCDIEGAKEGNWFDFDWFLELMKKKQKLA